MTANAPFVPQIDGDFIPESSTALLLAGKSVKVPYINGATHDEGTAFGV
jgi:triacylglycerol lipase